MQLLKGGSKLPHSKLKIYHSMKLASFETASLAFPGNSLADSAEDLKFLRLKLKKWYKVSE
jgi:hypothetical protein